jgi:hypothetical protein
VHLEWPERRRRDVGVRSGWRGRRLGFGLRLGLKGLERWARRWSRCAVPRAAPAAPENVQELAAYAPVLFRGKGVGPLVDFPLGETAVAGGRLEINGDTLVLGAATPQLADGVHLEAGPGSGPSWDAAEIGQRAFGVGRERAPG